jgi:hypothetical protein
VVILVPLTVSNCVSVYTAIRLRTLLPRIPGHDVNDVEWTSYNGGNGCPNSYIFPPQNLLTGSRLFENLPLDVLDLLRGVSM